MRSEVQIFPGPPLSDDRIRTTDDGLRFYLSSVVRPLSSDGAIAQLGERLLCKQEVVGSIPSGSTRRLPTANSSFVRNSIRALSTCRCARLLSDIVKRRSIRALRVTERSRAARYSRHFHRRKPVMAEIAGNAHVGKA